MANDIHLNMDAYLGDRPQVQDGNEIGLWEWNSGNNQIWKISPHSVSGHEKHGGHKFGEGRSDCHGDDCPYSSSHTHHSNHSGHASNLSKEPTVKICCKADPKLNLSVRFDKVVLAKADPYDEHQHWFKDDKFGSNVKDEEGFPGFALVNKATGLALKHACGAAQPVQLACFNSNDLSLMWSESKVIDNEGYRRIRMFNNIHLNMDVYLGDHPDIQEGNKIVLWEWKNGDNQIWKISSHCKF
ncbi:ricin B-like lectin R40G3 isoform X1 [Gossypium raimondii]|nr:ricin B-like lectin R40G3 isoform X1 [Gossypium raimondii]